jgi:G3E family GTPase
MVSAINPLAPRKRTEYSRVDLDWVLDIKSYRGTAVPEGIERISAAAPSHSSGFLRSHGFDFAGALDRTVLERMLDGLLYNNGSTGSADGMKVYRIKGILHILGDSRLWVLQGVHDVFELTRSEIDRGSSADRTAGRNRVIAIGKQLMSELLEERFVDCIATHDV